MGNLQEASKTIIDYVFCLLIIAEFLLYIPKKWLTEDRLTTMSQIKPCTFNLQKARTTKNGQSALPLDHIWIYTFLGNDQ